MEQNKSTETITKTNDGMEIGRTLGYYHSANMFSPIPVQQGYRFTRGYIEAYLDERKNVGASPGQNPVTVESIALIAAGRLEWILSQANHQLSGIFTEAEMTLMMESFKGEVFAPFQFEEMPEDFLEEDKVKTFVNFDNLPWASQEIIDKLKALTPLQHLTLCELIERAHHRGELSIREFFKSKNIELS